MTLPESTFNTSRVLDNEIIKASDFNFAFETLIENVSKSTQMMLESTQDFVINGKVLPYLVDNQPTMNVQVSPIYGVCKSSGVPFGRTDLSETVTFSTSTNGRVDILQVKGDWQTYDNQQRAFNDPDTDVQTYQYVDTKKLMKPIYLVKQGVEGASVAPEVDSGYVKLAEVVIRTGATGITEEDIKNITADVAGLNNEDWTTQKNITFNIGYISDVNARFRVQHNEDGTHKDNVIDTDSLNIGVGSKQVNGSVLPVGGNVSIPNESISSTDSILSVITKSATMITSLYNSYLKFGAYGFKAENGLKISAIADNSNVLTKPLTFYAAGDGTATIKIGTSTILSIDSQGKLSTNGYTASSANHIVTKSVTDAISTALTNLTTRVNNLENTSDSTVYANGALSMGTDGCFNVNSVSIKVATTTNITLANAQTIDGQGVLEDDIVLVKNQTNAKENGIYVVSGNSLWFRVTDFDTPEKLKGRLFFVSSGTNNGQRMFYIPKVNFISGESFGQDDILFLEYMATSKPKANRIIIRDENGRAQVAAPVAENDIARKAEITALYSSTNPVGLGTASPGIATTFSRSDHVHPIPSCVLDKYNTARTIGIGYTCASLTCAQISAFAAFSSSYDAGGCLVIKDVSIATVKEVLSLGSAAYTNSDAYRSCTWIPSCISDGTAYAEAGHGNEFNIFPAVGNTQTWINYRGGSSLLKIGNGASNGCLGAISASCFCGTATYADLVKYICQDYFTGNCDRPVMISTRDGSTVAWQNGTAGTSVCCRFTFNPATGVLCAKCFCGTAACAELAAVAQIGDIANRVKSLVLTGCSSCPVFKPREGYVCNNSGNELLLINTVNNSILYIDVGACTTICSYDRYLYIIL